MRYAIYSDANTPLLSIKEIGYSDEVISNRVEFLGYEFSYSNMAKMLKANPK